jgi:hypothetical protein
MGFRLLEFPLGVVGGPRDTSLRHCSSDRNRGDRPPDGIVDRPTDRIVDCPIDGIVDQISYSKWARVSVGAQLAAKSARN